MALPSHSRPPDAGCRGVAMSIASCGHQVEISAKFCSECGGVSTGATDGANTGGVPGSVTVTQPPAASHWYRTRGAMTVFFLLLTPVWAILLLTDGTARRLHRGFSAVIVVAYAIYFVPLLATLFGAAGSATLTGPATIQFGDYNQETSGQ